MLTAHNHAEYAMLDNSYKIDCFEVSIASTGYSETFPGNRAGGFDSLECFNLLVQASEDAKGSSLFTKREIVLTRINATGKVAHVITN